MNEHNEEDIYIFRSIWFSLSLLESNRLSNSQNILCTKQSTSALFSTELRKLTNTITDIAQKVDIIREGGSLLYWYYSSFQ